MSNFVPVIYEEQDGTQVFRNDLVDIEFIIDGSSIKKRFDLGQDAAPPIPFSVAGSFMYQSQPRIFVVDSMGTSWVERQDGSLTSTSSRLLLMVLMHCDSPHFEAVLSIVKNERNDDGLSE